MTIKVLISPREEPLRRKSESYSSRKFENAYLSKPNEREKASSKSRDPSPRTSDYMKTAKLKETANNQMFENEKPAISLRNSESSSSRTGESDLLNEGEPVNRSNSLGPESKLPRNSKNRIPNKSPRDINIPGSRPRKTSSKRDSDSSRSDSPTIQKAKESSSQQNTPRVPNFHLPLHLVKNHAPGLSSPKEQSSREPTPANPPAKLQKQDRVHTLRELRKEKLSHKKMPE